MKTTILLLMMVGAALTGFTQGSDTATKNTKATICKGITKAGKPCKKHTKSKNGFCNFHQPKAK